MVNSRFKMLDKTLDIDCSHACTVAYSHMIPSSSVFELPELDRVLSCSGASL